MTNPISKPVLKASVDHLLQLRDKHHASCVVCGQANPQGLGIDFKLCSDGSVMTTIKGKRYWQGYNGHLHGGMAATLLDGAMTHCLFAHGIKAYTAELHVRFRKTLKINQSLTVRARRLGGRGTLHLLNAELRQEDNVAVFAEGKFISQKTSINHPADKQ